MKYCCAEHVEFALEEMINTYSDPATIVTVGRGKIVNIRLWILWKTSGIYCSERTFSHKMWIVFVDMWITPVDTM